MALPLIPLLKILALGSLKIIFLLFGAAFFPVLSLRFILTGASSMIQPTLDWLEANGRLDADRHIAVIEDLNALSKIDFTRAEARHLLLKLIGKTFSNMWAAFLAVPATVARWVAQLFQR